MVRDQLRARGIRSPEVLAAMGRVPRERFVPAGMVARTYDDRAMGIAGGQTISQPYIVARMTEALDLPGWQARHGGRAPSVLDVGTGSGYQAAVLAQMGAEVVSIERDQDLAEPARERLAELGYAVEIVLGDGTEGWPERAPYAGIVAAAAAPEAPAPLVDQLADDGRLVIPLGGRFQQELTVVARTPIGVQRWELEPCVFVPLVGRYGFEER